MSTRTTKIYRSIRSVVYEDTVERVDFCEIYPIKLALGINNSVNLTMNITITMMTFN